MQEIPPTAAAPQQAGTRLPIADRAGGRPTYIWSMATALEVTLLPGARALLHLHARELPQKDDLCGAFCVSLALRAGGVRQHDGAPLDQEAVALAAASVVSEPADVSALPDGETGRRDYRVELPKIPDPKLSGTTAAGLIEAVEELAGGELCPLPYSGPWTAATLAGLFDALALAGEAAALVVNLATGHLWGSHATLSQLLAHLQDGELDGPEADWQVGHFACVIGRVRGAAGELYALADTYPALGKDGVHMQPGELLARAIARPEGPAGGAIAIVSPADAAAVRSSARGLGLEPGSWDNGTVKPR